MPVGTIRFRGGPHHHQGYPSLAPHTFVGGVPPNADSHLGSRTEARGIEPHARTHVTLSRRTPSPSGFSFLRGASRNRTDVIRVCSPQHKPLCHRAEAEGLGIEPNTVRYATLSRRASSPSELTFREVVALGLEPSMPVAAVLQTAGRPVAHDYLGGGDV